jgi:hypothetical protein
LAAARARTDEMVRSLIESNGSTARSKAKVKKDAKKSKKGAK